MGAGYVSKTYSDNGKDLDAILTDAQLKYITGEIDEAALPLPGGKRPVEFRRHVQDHCGNERTVSWGGKLKDAGWDGL
jgi:hypothetical protein